MVGGGKYFIHSENSHLKEEREMPSSLQYSCRQIIEKYNIQVTRYIYILGHMDFEQKIIAESISLFEIKKIKVIFNHNVL